MVSCDRRHIMYCLWLGSVSRPGTPRDRNDTPPAINIDPSLDGGSTNLFAAALHMSRAPWQDLQNVSEVWADLYDNWDHYDPEFRAQFEQDLRRLHRIAMAWDRHNPFSLNVNHFDQEALRINSSAGFAIELDQPVTEPSASTLRG